MASLHREWLSLLSTFYNSHRHGRYTFRAVPDVFEEKRLFQQFLAKHLAVDLGNDEWFSLRNSDQIRRFIGKVVKRITDSLFKLVSERAAALSIYTDEIRGDSKAIKTFHGTRLDFIDETIKKKELLLFLMSDKAAGPHIRMLKSIDALDLDPPMVPASIKALLNDEHLHHVGGVVDELYLDVKDKGARFALLDVMENEDAAYGFDKEDEDETGA